MTDHPSPERVKRRPSPIPPRKPFPKAVKATLLLRSGGICEAPGCNTPGKDFDHVKAVAIGGESTLENCQLLCRDCNAAKGIIEAKDAAKADRVGGRSGQQKRRRERKAREAESPSKKMGMKPWRPEGYVSPLNSKSPQYRKREFGR